MPSSSPVTAAEFAGLMAHIGFFETNPTLAVATSGGSDSMALLLLAHEWAAERKGNAIALTVDHGLRSESGQEAQQIHQWCTARGITHHTLVWQHPMLYGSIQSHARTARYALLSGWCKNHHVLHLLTAHHRDDQVETLFLRLLHGSQLTGLSCMSSAGITHGIRLLRPLLPVPKTRFLATLHARQQPWLEDPSNASSRYTRNLIRQHLNHSGNYSALALRAAKIVHAFAKLRSETEQATASRLADIMEIFPSGHALLYLSAFFTLPVEAGTAIISTLAMTIGGSPYPPRTEKTNRFYRQCQEEHFKRGTFGGCIFMHQPRLNRLLVYREPNAAAATAQLSLGTPYHWDNRFTALAISASSLAALPLLRQLGADGASLLAKHGLASLNPMEKSVLPTLPSFWLLDELVAVPHMGYSNEKFRHIACSIRFNPVKMLAGPSFFGMNRSIVPLAQELL